MKSIYDQPKRIRYPIGIAFLLILCVAMYTYYDASQSIEKGLIVSGNITNNTNEYSDGPTYSISVCVSNPESHNIIFNQTRFTIGASRGNFQGNETEHYNSPYQNCIIPSEKNYTIGLQISPTKANLVGWMECGNPCVCLRLIKSNPGKEDSIILLATSHLPLDKISKSGDRAKLKFKIR